MRNRKIISLAAAAVLATSSVTAPAHAAPASSGARVEAIDSTTQEQGSSDAEIAGLVVGVVAATLALAGGAGFLAIQQGLIPNPLLGVIPGPQPAPAPAAPAPVRYGDACRADEILQPIHSPDGWLVCVTMGPDKQTWVYGPAPRGRGTARQGAYCREGESGGQDDHGRMMMCISNQWIYGP